MKYVNNPYSEILKELEETLWEHDYLVEKEKANIYTYSNDDFRAAMKIFMSACMWKIWDRQEKDNFSMDMRIQEVEDFAEKLKILCELYLNIDVVKLYN